MKFQILLLIFFVNSIFGESIDFEAEKPFFNKAASSYQAWMSSVFPKNTIRLYTSCPKKYNCPVDFQKGKLVLFLEFDYADGEDTEHAAAKWIQVKEGFEKNNSGLKLAEALFYKMLQEFEITKEDAQIDIYDTYDLKRKSEFSSSIEYAIERKEVRESLSRAVVIEMNLPKIKVKNKNSDNLDISENGNEALYEAILEFAKQKYEKQVCQEREPKVTLLENEEILRFEVIDLCKEVLSDESNHPIALVMNKVFKTNLNWEKRVKLDFTFKQFKDKETNKSRLSITVNGKYGSGFFKPRKSGYIDMDPQYTDQLKDYVANFKEELKKNIFKKSGKK